MLTDNEIIKAIEICAQNSVTRHNGLTYQGMPLRFLFEEILGFVNRQKAEIEKLTKLNDILLEAGQRWQKCYETSVKEYTVGGKDDE